MAESLATSAQPSPDVWELVRQWWTPILAVLGGAWAGVKAWRKWRATEMRLRAQDRKNVRYLLDAQRQTLEAIIGPSSGRAIDIEELRRQQVLISEVREETWLADGHPPRPKPDAEAEQARADVRELLTRTQAIRLVLERDAKTVPPMFKDGWRGDDIK